MYPETLLATRRVDRLPAAAKACASSRGPDGHTGVQPGRERGCHPPSDDGCINPPDMAWYSMLAVSLAGWLVIAVVLALLLGRGIRGTRDEHTGR
jgi:hypothetical protein